MVLLKKIQNKSAARTWRVAAVLAVTQTLVELIVFLTNVLRLTHVNTVPELVIVQTRLAVVLCDVSEFRGPLLAASVPHEDT